MEILVLVDGTELHGLVMPSGDGLSIYLTVYDMSIVEGAVTFSNKQNIATIVAHDHGTDTTYEGFTELTSVDNEFGNCNVVLRRQINAT